MSGIIKIGRLQHDGGVLAAQFQHRRYKGLGGGHCNFSAIGYTTGKYDGIGTFYNLFENLDDLIGQLNASTLDRLYGAVTLEHVEPGPEAALRAYAGRYITFTGKNQNLWGAVFEHRLPNGQDRPDWYETRVLRLLGLAEEALKPFFRPGEEAERLHNARVLWGSLYGICSLAQSGSLPPTESASSLVDTLIGNYIDALKKRRRSAKQKTPTRPSVQPRAGRKE